MSRPWTGREVVTLRMDPGIWEEAAYWSGSLGRSDWVRQLIRWALANGWQPGGRWEKQ